MISRTWSLNEKQLLGEVNKTKEQLLEYLADNGIISEDLCKELKDAVAFMLIEKGIFGKSIDKMFKLEDNKIQYQICRIEPEPELEEEDSKL